MSIAVKDANAVDRTVKTTELAGVHTPHQNVDNLPALPPGANHIGSVEVDASVLPAGAATAAGQLPDGHNVTVDNAAGASAVNVQDGGNSLTVDGTVTLGAGSANVGDVDVASFAAGAMVEVQGDVAHGVAIAGNPVQTGVFARSTEPTAVDNGDVAYAYGDTLGKQVVLLGSTHERIVSGTANFTTTTAADVIAAQGAGVRIVVTSVLVVNAHATTGTKVEIRDGTTVKVLALAAAAGGGWSASNVKGLFVSTANTAVTARCVTTAADVDVNISGYTISN